MDDSAPETRANPRWPYISWKTLFNLIQKFEADGGELPPRIDRSVLGGSEGQKTQLMAALRFLGLMAENGAVTPLFQRIVKADDKARQPLIRDLLAQHYAEATKLGKENATTKQLEETFTGLNGDTLRKAMTFYIHGAKYSGHPLSKHFKTPSGFRPAGGTRKQRTANANSQAPAPVAPAIVSAKPTDARSRYIDMLMEKASTATDPEVEKDLLNRIERILELDAGTTE